MKIALAQMNVKAGQPKKNLDNMLSMIEEAKLQKVDLIAFPEMCIGGYLVGDKWTDDNYCQNLMKFNEKILQASKDIAIIFGNVYLDNDTCARTGIENYHPNKDGRSRKYNAVYVYQNGNPAQRLKETRLLPEGVQPKTLLPNYRFFDDERYFFSLEDIAKDFGRPLEEFYQPFILDIKGKKVKIGVAVCEDLWVEDYRRNGDAENPTKMLIDNGAEYVINISASPWTFGKNGSRDKKIKILKEQSGKSFVPFFYVNHTGVQNNGKNIITFDGGSTVYDKNGMPIVLCKKPYLEELIIVDESELTKTPIQRIETSKISQKYDAIIEGIRHMKDIRGKEDDQNFVIGLSGGIDSAVVAALLVKAIGVEKIIGINMPTVYNSEKTKKVASKVAESLGIKYLEIPIQELVDINQKALEEPDGSGKKLSSLNLENIQAKIRGTSILSNFAAKNGALFTNNGNKLEIALGYATLYGDVGGGIAPIGDLTKMEIFDLARYINEEIYKKEIIPEILIPDELCQFRKDQIQPSAELKESQVDPMKFGYHDALLETMTDYKKKSAEDTMRWYIEGTLEQNLGITTAMINRWNIDKPKEFVEDLEWFAKSIQNSVFKRVQAPPIIITSKTSYGYDLRESMLPFETSLEHERLKKKILNMKEYKTKEATE